MAETLMKPKGLGISSPHCGSYLALIGERQDTSSVRRMILHGAGSFLALRVEVARSLDANSSLSNCWSSSFALPSTNLFAYSTVCGFPFLCCLLSAV